MIFDRMLLLDKSSSLQTRCYERTRKQGGESSRCEPTRLSPSPHRQAFLSLSQTPSHYRNGSARLTNGTFSVITLVSDAIGDNAVYRYYKNDYTLGQGQQKLKDRQMKSDRSTAQYPAVMLRLFREIKARFHPVLRHYFLERYMVPGLWLQMRLAYSRSVATTSIVGHVVGLGDRHISNILIDQNSGELIHIDLGIAFDQV